MIVKRCVYGVLAAAAVAAIGSAFSGGDADAAPKAKITSDCGRVNAATGELDKVQKAITALGTPAATARTVDVYFHVIYPASGPGLVTESQLDAQIAVLNAAFATGGWTFNKAGVDWTQNDTWFQMESGSRTEQQVKQALRRGGAAALNVYTVGAGNGGSFVGWGSFPWDYASDPKNDGVVVYYGALPGGTAAPYNLGDIAVHHVGHWLGLLHTFEGNCRGDGDYVADTAAEDGPAYGFPAGRDSCTHEPGLDPIENYMDFTDDAGKTHFTAGQFARMAAAFTLWRAP